MSFIPRWFTVYLKYPFATLLPKCCSVFHWLISTYVTVCFVENCTFVFRKFPFISGIPPPPIFLRHGLPILSRLSLSQLNCPDFPTSSEHLGLQACATTCPGPAFGFLRQFSFCGSQWPGAWLLLCLPPWDCRYMPPYPAPFLFLYEVTCSLIQSVSLTDYIFEGEFQNGTVKYRKCH